MATTLSQIPTGPQRRLGIKRYFRKVQDPRRRHLRQHLLIDLLVMAICAVICGANDWQEVVTFAQKREAWLRGFLSLPNGIPSHDTFERVFDRIDPQAFQAGFADWLADVCADLNVKHIAIDGKTLRRSGTSKLGPLHVVSAWATANHLILGQVAVADKSNEIPAIPALLELFVVRGALVTIDAMGCQKEIARTIVERGGDYVLTVKENQPHLLADIQACFIRACEQDFAGVDSDTYETETRDHGRHEKRTYTIIRSPEGIRHPDEWENLQVVGLCYSERTVNGVTSEETRYFIGSRRASAKVYGGALRNHWGIENGLHWQMDVTFGEDDSRIRKRRGAENFALVRRLALRAYPNNPAQR